MINPGPLVLNIMISQAFFSFAVYFIEIIKLLIINKVVHKSKSLDPLLKKYSIYIYHIITMVIMFIFGCIMLTIKESLD